MWSPRPRFLHGRLVHEDDGHVSGGRRGRAAEGGHPVPEPRRRPLALPLLRLFCDCTAQWPLWVASEGGMVDAEHLGLSDDLVQRVAFWNEHFQQGYGWECGWDTPEHGRWHREEGVDLSHRLARELDGRHQVEHEDRTSKT